MDVRPSITEPTLTANGKTAADKAEIRAEKTAIKSDTASIAEALEQMKSAASSVYQALNSIGLASADIAKQKMEKGKDSAKQMESTAEDYLRERPLTAVGIAFAAGWLVSKLLSGGRR